MPARRKRQSGGRRWSARVTQKSDALDIEQRAFTLHDPPTDRSIPEALGGAQPAAKGRPLSIGDVDAEFLYQPSGKEPAGNAQARP
jgi:hypothetical protein